MNIYDVAELQQYLNPRGIDPRSFQSIFPMGVPFDPRSIQSIFPTNFPTGITASSAAIPFGSPVDIEQGLVEGSPSDASFLLKPLRYDPRGNFYMIDPSINDDTQDVGEKEKSSGILDLMGMLIPGFNILRNLDSQPYERFTPGANIRGGIYSIGDFNQPVGLVNDFYNPNTGLNRFQRAEEKFKRTGSMKDLFAASRSGAEFFRRRRELRDAQTKAALEKRKRERDIQKFTGGGGGDNRPSFTGTGNFATFDTSGKDYGPFSR